MERLTKTNVSVDPTATVYMGKEVNLQDMNDRLLDLVLNGPTLNGVSKDVLRQIIRQLYDVLKHYEDMEEQGQLKIFPCQVGDKAYWINGGQIKDCKVHRIQVNRKGTFLVLKSTVVHGAFNIGIIGHTLFLTREEAEKALKGGAKNGDWPN